VSWCCHCGEHWATHGTACKPRTETVSIPCPTLGAQQEAIDLIITLRARVHALEREQALVAERAAGHPGMCCGQCIAAIEAVEIERDTAHAAGVAEATERCAKIARESSVEGDYLSRLFRASTTPPTAAPNEPGIPNLDSPEEEGRDGG